MKYYVVSLIKKDGSYDEKYICLNTSDIEEALKAAENMYCGMSDIERDHLITYDLTFVDGTQQTVQDLLKNGYEPLKEFIPVSREKITKHEYLTVCIRDDWNTLPINKMVDEPRILRTDGDKQVGDLYTPIKYHGAVEYKVIEKLN